MFYLKTGFRHNKIFYLFDRRKFNNMIHPIRTLLYSDIPNVSYAHR